jgi:hypothetical protein
MLLDVIEVTTTEAAVVWETVTIEFATLITCSGCYGLQELGEPGLSNNHGYLRQ